MPGMPRTVVPNLQRDGPGMKLYYNHDYVAAKMAFDTTRKSALVAASLQLLPIKGVDVVSPFSATLRNLRLCHTDAYIDAVWTGKPKALASSSGFPWDKGIWCATTASTGGVISAALHSVTTGENSGSLSSGLHHAYADEGQGFCTFNGLAIAAKTVSGYGKRVLIVDFDAHNGGGTQSLIEDDASIDQINVSTSPYDWYKTDRDNDYNVVIGQGNKYLGECMEALDHAHDNYAYGEPYDLILYNAGMDPYQHCDTGGLWGIDSGVLAQREAYVFEWAARHNTPVAFVLAGGYTGKMLSENRLVDLHRLTIAAAVV